MNCRRNLRGCWDSGKAGAVVLHFAAMKNRQLTVAFALLIALLSARVSWAAEDSKGKLLYHVVCLKFKPDAGKEQIANVEKAFKDLKGKIPAIHGLTWGTNNSPEKLEKG